MYYCCCVYTLYKQKILITYYEKKVKNLKYNEYILYKYKC